MNNGIIIILLLILIVKSIKYFREQIMKLGNLIEIITRYSGIKWIWKKVSPNCKCDERQESLNDIELWQKI